MSIQWDALSLFLSPWRRHRQSRAWKQRRREFVYLDEVSVTSLVAARQGSIAQSFTHSESSALSAENGSSLSAPAGIPFFGAALSSRTSSSATTSREVVRHAVAQGTFRELRIGDSNLRLSTEDQMGYRKRPAAAGHVAELSARLKKLEKQCRAVNLRDLRRGDVMELVVELQAERTYQITAALTSMLDLVRGNEGAFGISERQLAEVVPLMEILPRLLVDLVPVEARVTSHRRVMVDGDAWLVDSSIITPHSELASLAEDVGVVGVTELKSYWKDVRRVLFDGSSYTVYARVTQPRFTSRWSPIKLADVLGAVSPEVGEQIKALPTIFEQGPVTKDADPSAPTKVLRDVGLVPFGRALAQQTDRHVNVDQIEAAADRASNQFRSNAALQSVPDMRAAFEEIVRAVEACPPLPLGAVDRELVRALRERYQAAAQAAAAQARRQAIPGSVESPRLKRDSLEVEVVAIYW